MFKATLLLALAFLLPSANAQAPVASYTPDTGVLTSTTTIEAFVHEKATESHLQGLYETLKYESQGWKNQQSTIPHAGGPNGLEDSWGVCQIHLPDHPDITKEEALDPVFCVNWTIEQFKKGHADWWTGYRLYETGKLDDAAGN